MGDGKAQHGGIILQTEKSVLNEDPLTGRNNSKKRK